MAFQRTNGVWYSDFIAPDLENPSAQRRYRLSLGQARNRREAETAERKMLTDIEQQTTTHVKSDAPAVQTTGNLPAAAFSGFAKFWLDTYAKVHLRPSTTIRHEKTIRVWLVPFFGDCALTTITRLDIHRFIAMSASSRGKSTNHKLSPKTINEHLSCLSSMMTKAVEWGYLQTNPCTGVDRLELDPEEWDFYTAEETDQWLTACKNHEPRWFPFFLMGFRTGLRLGELFALEWGDIDFRNRKIHVRKAISGGEVTLPKSRKRRTVEMSPQLSQTLQDHRHMICSLVFCAQSGERLNRDRIKHPWERITRLAGLRQIRHHDMRHSFASQLVMKGVPLLAVQQLLGHASLNMTMRYAHLAPGASQQFVSLLDDVSAGTFSEPTWHNNGTALVAGNKKCR